MHVGTDMTCLLNTGFVSIFQNRDGQGCSFLYKIKHDRRSFCAVPSRMSFFKMMNGIFQNDETRKIFEPCLNIPDARSTGMLIMSTTK
jgi:hypothetical protein